MYWTDYEHYHNLTWRKHGLLYAYNSGGWLYLLGVERYAGKKLNVYQANEISNKIFAKKCRRRKMKQIQKSLKKITHLGRLCPTPLNFEMYGI